MKNGLGVIKLALIIVCNWTINCVRVSGQRLISVMVWASFSALCWAALLHVAGMGQAHLNSALADSRLLWRDGLPYGGDSERVKGVGRFPP